MTLSCRRGQQRLAARLKGRLHAIEPIRFATRLDPERILYLDAGRDDCFPEVARDELWQEIGRPARIRFDHRHRWSFLAMTALDGHFATDEILTFLDEKL